ncbi:hypothetical protein Airi02_061050 [Actinoallomurus iriomotensis]|uniref:DUF2690 domain-containing protein n=2 Tax=Actinoallomurus iriomotensis TaxID=478107 RepID=A0A9W6W3P2_9ACTN|nr:hypothetical protein Airi02_061050 [Actinoallomurus iriomotensis]
MRIRRLTVLLAVAATAGITVTTLATTASAATGRTARPNAACDETAGKYAGHVITSYDITGGDDSTQGVPGGTLQVWASEKCRTLWTRTVKLPEYTNSPYYTVAAISYYDAATGTWVKKSTEKATTDDVESPTVPAPRAGSFPIEGGFVGPYQFNTAQTFRY